MERSGRTWHLLVSFVIYFVASCAHSMVARSTYHSQKSLPPMRPSEALSQHRDAVCLAVARYGVANPWVFGSALRGDDLDGSDLDLLVDTLPGTTLFDLGGLQDELQELLGVSVDVLTLKDLPAKFRDSVAREARPV